MFKNVSLLRYNCQLVNNSGLIGTNSLHIILGVIRARTIIYMFFITYLNNNIGTQLKRLKIIPHLVLHVSILCAPFPL